MLQVFIIVMRILNTYLYIIAQKKGLKETPFYYSVLSIISTDARSGKCNRSGLSSSKIQREIVCVSLVHHFHPKTSTVKDISPGVNNTTLTINDRLVEVKTVEVECHRGNTKSSEPDANNRPSSE